MYVCTHVYITPMKFQRGRQFFNGVNHDVYFRGWVISFY